MVLEGSGAAVVSLPPFTSWPPVSSVLYLTVDGDTEVAYKVEDYETYAHVITQIVNPPGSPDVVGVECYAKMIVSVVP